VFTLTPVKALAELLHHPEQDHLRLESNG